MFFSETQCMYIMELSEVKEFQRYVKQFW